MPTLLLLLKRENIRSTRISVLSILLAVTVSNSNSASRRMVLLLIHALEQGVHSEDMTSIDLKRGIDPLFLEYIYDEIERDTTPREILRLIKAKDWNDSVDFPTEIQISNRKSHIAHNKEGPLTQYKYAVNIKNWVTENILKSKEQYQALHPHQWFTMGFVEYEKSTTKEACIAFAYTTKGESSFFDMFEL
jgi:hypothetical protein